MTVAIVDYDSGNLHSAQKAFQKMAAGLGVGDVVVTDCPDIIASADRIVLPGDGAFPACWSALNAKTGIVNALETAVHKRAVPFLGICVGMQLLASKGFEFTETPGLDWIGGEIHHIDVQSSQLKVPHMGWNDIVKTQDHPVLADIDTADHVYFVHSYHFVPKHEEDRFAHCDYGHAITAVVARDNMIGFQFHPEKSQSVGLKLISNFLNWAPNG